MSDAAFYAALGVSLAVLAGLAYYAIWEIK